MGSYAGSSDWDDVPALDDRRRFAPAATPPGTPGTAGAAGAVAAATRGTPGAGDDQALDLPAARPTRPIDLIIAFDVTTSMDPYIENVREKIAYLVEGLLKLMDIRIALVGIADHTSARLMQTFPFSRNLEELRRNIQSMEIHLGNKDYPEAYECLFHHLNHDPMWATDRPVLLVLIGDSVPHGLGYVSQQFSELGCPQKIDARAELATLLGRVRSFYFVSCGNDQQAIRIQKTLVRSPNYHLQLDNFRRLTNLLMAVCMDEVGELDYFLDLLEKQRGRDRRAEVLALLHR
jgi:hypothetical protein